jgi:two-component system nitrate/nitrite response regulator NarL
MPDARPFTSVCIADDHPVFRHGLRKLIELEDDLRVVGEAEDGLSAIECVRTKRPDVMLLDIAMPKLGGLEALPDLVAANPHTRVLLVTAGIGRVELVRALQLGARGVVLKEAATRLVGQAVRAVASGSYWVGPEAVADLVGALKQLTEGPEDRRFGLTPREIDIVTAVVAGQTNRDIATQLSIREQTVKHHLTSIFDKVGVSTRLELALFALKHKLVPDP